MAQWVIVITALITTIIAIGGLVYNTIVTYAILRNDVKHLKEDNEEIKSSFNNLREEFREDVKELRKYITDAILKAMAKGDCDQIDKLEQELFGIDENKGD